MTLALIKAPKTVRTGEVFEVAATIAHVMDSGYKPGSDGRLIPRNILQSFTCYYNDALVFEAQLFPAISSNPFLSFHVRAQRSGMLRLNWRGDRGFEHTETWALEVT